MQAKAEGALILVIAAARDFLRTIVSNSTGSMCLELVKYYSILYNFYNLKRFSVVTLCKVLLSIYNQHILLDLPSNKKGHLSLPF